ncbi:MAG: hydantoinase/oxoprolinase family protein, partial [Clostridia bacterium]|nr:hydantoinase/oxoprolinase family protein [Clostridia bacterium]
MALIIGIDTGGTYTDAVIYDNQTRQVLARGKSPTTHEELSVGIGKALDTLPTQLLKSARAVALSTTLATNACVEGKGCRARVVNRVYEKWDQHKLDAARRVLGSDAFDALFRAVW